MYDAIKPFNAGQSVILDATEANDKVALNIVAFALGLVSHGDGSFDRLATRVFLLGHGRHPGKSDRG